MVGWEKEHAVTTSMRFHWVKGRTQEITLCYGPSHLSVMTQVGHRAGPCTLRQIVLGPEAEVPFRIVLGTVEMKEELNEHGKPQKGTAATSVV